MQILLAFEGYEKKNAIMVQKFSIKVFYFKKIKYLI